MEIPAFIERCNAYCAAAGISRVTLSKKLFDDTRRLNHLAAGVSDVGVMRLARAVDTLSGLERALAAKVTA